MNVFCFYTSYLHDIIGIQMIFMCKQVLACSRRFAVKPWAFRKKHRYRKTLRM